RLSLPSQQRHCRRLRIPMRSRRHAGMGRTGEAEPQHRKEVTAMATWINFKELRERIRIADVLKQYNVQLKVRGEKATGLCPLPTHPARSDGKKRSPSFSVHLGKGI